MWHSMVSHIKLHVYICFHHMNQLFVIQQETVLLSTCLVVHYHYHLPHQQILGDCSGLCVYNNIVRFSNNRTSEYTLTYNTYMVMTESYIHTYIHTYI